MYGERSSEFQPLLQSYWKVTSRNISRIFKNAYREYQDVAQFIYGDTTITDATPAVVKKNFLAQRLAMVYAEQVNAGVLGGNFNHSPVFRHTFDGTWYYESVRVHPVGGGMGSVVIASHVTTGYPGGEGGSMDIGIIGECFSRSHISYASGFGTQHDRIYQFIPLNMTLGNYKVGILYESLGPTTHNYYVYVSQGSSWDGGKFLKRLNSPTKIPAYSFVAGNGMPQSITVDASSSVIDLTPAMYGCSVYNDGPINLTDSKVVTHSFEGGIIGLTGITGGTFSSSDITALDATAAAAAIFADW